MAKKINHTGETFITNEGYKVTIEKSISYSENYVIFDDEYQTRIKCQYQQLKNGTLNNPNHPSVYGVGFIGVGEPTDKVIYSRWHDMIRRCYDNNYLKTHPTYVGCSVCDEWKCYQNFKDWYKNNFYQIQESNMCLDKDILCKNNKIYSPDTCIFVPQEINKLFTLRNNDRGDYPLGVYKNKDNGKFIAQCNDPFSNKKNKQMVIGHNYDTPKDAYEAYKKYKYKVIKEIAEKYKNDIPEKLYNALINYKID